jgi:hypothetical protein
VAKAGELSRLNPVRFAGRVGTGFSEKLLHSLFSELNKIRVEECPFFNVPAAGRSRRDQGLTGCRNETLPLGQTINGLPDKIHRVDA